MEEYKLYWIDQKGNRLKVRREVLITMEGFRQISRKEKEAGGVLVGRYLVEGNDVVIDLVTEPTRYDKRKRLFFSRSSKIHNEFVQKEWEKSLGTLNYVGEWHTHPEKTPKPSTYDLKSWRTLLEELDAELKFIFFIIVGTESIGIWKGYLKSQRIEEMKGIVAK